MEGSTRILLAERTRADVYVCDAPEGRVVLKVLREEAPSARDLLGLDNAIAVTRDLPPATAVGRAIRKARVDGRHALVSAHADGVTIDRWAKGRSLAAILRAASEVAQTLGELHERGVVHKDVKPGHIVVDPRTGRATLIDFAIAARVEHASPRGARADALEGTLAYMSPEQTGRVNRVVDSRSDLYSFGATLFELLTGRAPFEAKDAIELVHAHIAKVPPSPRTIQPSLPVALADVVLKLLAKNPEDRYATAFGLKHDLERVLADLERGGAAERFALGAHDRSARLQIPPRLYGREREIAAMRGAFERACAGGVACVLLTGEGGAGKSALADELRGPITARRGVFAEGKFDQLQRGTPYVALRRVLAEIVDALLTERDESLATTRRRVVEEVGGALGALRAVVPNLERLVGPVPEPAPARGEEAQRRLHFAARAFMRACATPDRPVAIALDDLQWADAASLDLIEKVLTDPRAAHVTILGAYRGGEIGAHHPLIATIEAIAAAGVAIDRVEVPALVQGDVAALVSDALHARPDDVAELASLVFAKTHGNPFFVRQFLQTLVDRGAIAFDTSRVAWRWDLAAARALGVTDNVVDLLAAKIRSLPAESRRIVQLAACVGNRFDVETLARASERSVAETARSAWAAMELGLLRPIGEAYRLAAASDGAGAADAAYAFVHDRVQQAAYSLFDESERSAVHLQIGRQLLARTPIDRRDEILFDVVYHLNRAGDRVSGADERRELAELNLAAGRAARTGAAYGPALEYFRASLARIAGDAWTGDYALALALHGDAADAAYLTRDYDESERLARIVVERGAGALDKLKAYDALVGCGLARDDLAGVLAVGVAALRDLGQTFPANPKTPQIVLALLRTKMALAGKPVESLAALPEMKDERTRAAMRLIERMIPAAFRSGSKLFPLFVFRLVNLSLSHGNMPVSCFGYAAYAITLCGVLGDFENGYRFGQLALDLVDKLGAESFRPQVLFVANNFVRHWKEPLASSLEGFARATRVGLETGNVFEAVWATFYRVLWSVHAGAEIAAVDRELADNEAFFAQDDGSKNLSLLLREVLATLASPDAPSLVLSGRYYDERAAAARFATSSDKTEVAAFHVLKLELAMILGDAKQAVTHADEAEKYREAITGLPYVGLLELHGALARAALHEVTGDASLLRKAAKSAKKLRGWAAHSPRHHEHRALLVEAELARARGRSGEATSRYDAAIRAAHASGVLQEEALACERAALHHAALGNEVVAASLRRHAIATYRQWGAVAKVRALEPVVAGDTTATPSVAPTVASIDLASVMKAASVITSELDSPRLLRRLVEIAIENAGAETGALLLARGAGELAVEARGSTSSPTEIGRVPLESAAGVNEAIVRYVARTGEHVVLSDAQSQGPFRHNADVAARHVRSVLCAPIKRQGAIAGILYLENGLAPGAFSRERIEVVSLLAAQAAIALENARLFDAHKRFVPDEFLQSLGRTRIVDVALGDSVEREMSILFSDIRAFTAHVEGMRPDENIHFINTYLREMEPPIVRHGGFVDSYVGDAIMALFGGEADAAVRAAVEMLRALATLNASRASQGKRPIHVGIGVNTGLLTLGTIGGGSRIKCGVIGDSVNLAARVEGLTKAYGVPLLVSEHTRVRLREAHDVRVVDRVRVVGKSEPVTLFEVFDADADATRDAKRSAAAAWDEGLALYYARDFAGAAQRFETCAARLPDDAPTRIFLERSRARARDGVPSSWNGVEELHRK